MSSAPAKGLLKAECHAALIASKDVFTCTVTVSIKLSLLIVETQSHPVIAWVACSSR